MSCSFSVLVWSPRSVVLADADNLFEEEMKRKKKKGRGEPVQKGA